MVTNSGGILRSPSYKLNHTNTQDNYVDIQLIHVDMQIMHVDVQLIHVDMQDISILTCKFIYVAVKHYYLAC